MISYYFSVASKVNNEMSKEEKESMQLLSKELPSFFLKYLTIQNLM